MTKKISSADILKLAQDSIFHFGRDDRSAPDRIIKTAHDDVYWPLIDNLNKLLAQARTQAQEAQEPREPISTLKVPVRTKVRVNAAGTSWEAAYAQTPEKSQKLYRAIYLILTRAGPCTDDELRARLERINFVHSYTGVTKRRGELTEAGWVRATAERRVSQYGGTMTVWEAVPE